VVTKFVDTGDADLSIAVTTADCGELRSLDQNGQSIQTTDLRVTDNEPRAVPNPEHRR
jgi:hypothetical protein